MTLAATHGYWNLESFWFLLIAILWIGYFVLEGFDFGVGMLPPVLGRDETDRRVLLGTIGPVWDGNEVWLLVAGGATFAAFPSWYATLFSGFYLALFLILVGLIVRGVAIEYRNKHDGGRWRLWWDRGITFGSVLPALLWGVAFADIVHGVPLDAHGEFTGNLLDLLHPYALVGGLASLSLFLLHGSVFLALRTTGELEQRARRTAQLLAPVATAMLLAFLAWTYANAVSAHDKGIVPGVVPIASIAALAAVGWLVRSRLVGFAFAATTLSIAFVTATIFLNLYPRVLVSSTAAADSLTIFTTSSSHYTLTVLSIVALLFTPVVLVYQGWTYWVFRARLGREDFAETRGPLDVLARSPLGNRSGSDR
jgi:cytochrome d ubiquinol oxidase subunit II